MREIQATSFILVGGFRYSLLNVFDWYGLVRLPMLIISRLSVSSVVLFLAYLTMDL